MLKQVEIFTDGSCLEIQVLAATVRFYAIAGRKNFSERLSYNEQPHGDDGRHRRPGSAERTL